MHFRPENSYDAANKVWSGHQERAYFSSDQSVGELIFHEMRRHPQLIAQITDSENVILTREQLHLNSMRVASYMRSLGLVQTDIVGIIARNTTHLSAVAYACFFNGIPFHSLNIIYEQDTIEKLFDITKPRLIFCDGDEYGKVKAATSKLNVKIITMRNHQSGSISIEEVLATAIELEFQPTRLEQGNNHTLAILCSSGTTGVPKAVTISNNHKILNSSKYLTTADVQLCLSTLDWVTGLLTTLISGVYSTTRIISDKPFDPAHFLHMIEKYKVSWLLVAPSHMAMMVNCPEFVRANLDSIHSYLYGGSRCSLEVQQLIRSRLKRDCLHLVYSFTEAGSTVAMNFNFDQKPNSVGRLSDGNNLKILTEQGERLGPNEVGEICIYNGHYWAGYYGNPEETSLMYDSELWFHTGDLGYMDDDCFLYIVDRKKDMLKYQNIMYYPHEIEEVISQMPDVAEVCVFGIWHPINGDEAAAAVVKKMDSKIKAQDVLSYVQQNISLNHKQLHGGAIIVNDLKRSPNGKTNRQATKAYFQEVIQKNYL